MDSKHSDIVEKIRKCLALATSPNLNESAAAAEMAQRLNTNRETGVVVVGVRPDSKAYKAGVQQGDLILEVNRQSVSSTGDLKQLLAKYKGGDGISLLVQRGNAGMMVLKMV